jgi:hypothetical protein
MSNAMLLATLIGVVASGCLCYLVGRERQKTRRTLLILTLRLRDCERRLDWWSSNGVVDLDDKRGPRRSGLPCCTTDLDGLGEGGRLTEFDPEAARLSGRLGQAAARFWQ